MHAGWRIAIARASSVRELNLPGGTHRLLRRVGGCRSFGSDGATACTVAEVLALDVGPFGGPLRLEGLALQLVASAVAWRYRDRVAPETLPCSAPPSIEALARQVGTNPAKRRDPRGTHAAASLRPA